jgi:hypothetical protein
MKLKGENRSTRGKTCPSATLSTTNPTWVTRDRTLPPDPGSNPASAVRDRRLTRQKFTSYFYDLYFHIIFHFLLGKCASVLQVVSPITCSRVVRPGHQLS